MTSFFTSFGYFATFEEDLASLSEFVSMLKPGGFLFLDLINKGHLIKHLVSDDRRSIEGAQVVQRRRLEDRGITGERTIVVKEIEISRPGSELERYEERVRLYDYSDILALTETFSLKHIATYGDETGGTWRPESSPRMALLLQASPPQVE